jgi:hypothetical protein
MRNRIYPSNYESDFSGADSRKIYSSNYEQDFSGIWDDIVGAFTQSTIALKEWAGDAYKTAGLYADEASQMISKGQNYIQSKYDELVENMNKAQENDAIIKDALAKMPSGPEKSKLQAQYNETTNMFTNYVLPLWNNLTKEISKPAMGFLPAVLPLIGYAGAGLMIACTAWILHVIAKQIVMLNDPELKKYVAQDQGIFSNLSNISQNLKWPIIIGGLAYMAVSARKILRR